MSYYLTYIGIGLCCLLFSCGTTTIEEQTHIDQTLSVTPEMFSDLTDAKVKLNAIQVECNLLRQRLRKQSNLSDNATFSLQQIESAYRTQQQILQEWEAKIKAAEQYEKAEGSTSKIVRDTHQSFQTTISQSQQTQKAMEITLVDISHQLE